MFVGLPLLIWEESTILEPSNLYGLGGGPRSGWGFKKNNKFEIDPERVWQLVGVASLPPKTFFLQKQNCDIRSSFILFHRNGQVQTKTKQE